MKKQLVTLALGLALLGGTTAWIATPTQPERYELHVVQYGETLEGIIRDTIIILMLTTTSEMLLQKRWHKARK